MASRKYFGIFRTTNLLSKCRVAGYKVTKFSLMPTRPYLHTAAIVNSLHKTTVCMENTSTGLAISDSSNTKYTAGEIHTAWNKYKMIYIHI